MLQLDEVIPHACSGTVIHRFERPQSTDAQVLLTSEDARYVNLDYRDYTLLVTGNLREKNVSSYCSRTILCFQYITLQLE